MSISLEMVSRIYLSRIFKGVTEDLEFILDCPKKKKNFIAQSCLTLCDPVDCSPSGSSVHGILQARILEWFATRFSRGSSQPRD